MGSVVVGQTFYVVHVKEGQLPPHHNYTVKFEINHGKFIFHSASEGYLSILWENDFHTFINILSQIKYSNNLIS